MKKLSLALCGILLLAAAVQAADSFLGSWTLNIVKSKYDPGPAPKSQTTKLEAAADNGVREIGDRINADRSRTQWEWTAKFDGKDYPVTGDPNSDTRSYTKVNERTLTTANKKNGKVTVTGQIVVSADGKSRTVTLNGTTPKGKKFKNVVVYDKQ